MANKEDDVDINAEDADKSCSSDEEKINTSSKRTERVSAIKLKRKQIRGKITRTIKRLNNSMNKHELSKRRATKELAELRSDYNKALDVNSPLFEYDSAQTEKLSKWESELSNDIFSIEERIEDYVSILSNSDRVKTRSVPSVEVSDVVRNSDDNTVVRNDVTNNALPNDVTNNAFPNDVMVTTDATRTVIRESDFVESPKHRQHEQTHVNHAFKRERDSVDLWIDRLTEYEETAIEFNHDMTLSEAIFRIEANRDIPTIRIPIFDGNALEYVEFIESFKIHIHDKRNLSDDMRMGQLKMHVTGEAAMCITGLGSSGSMYATALKSIKNMFGQPSVIARTFINKITKGGAIRCNDRESLRSYSTEIVNCLATLKRLNHLADVNSTESLRMIVSRLPDALISAWKHKVTDIRDNHELPTLQHISDFVCRKVRSAFDPDFGDIEGVRYETRDEPRRTEKRQGIHATQPFTQTTMKSTFRPVTQPTTESKRPWMTCPVCQSGEHRVPWCPKFGRASHDEKVNLIKMNKLCFSCLIKGHSSVECRNKKACDKDGCVRTHHPLLHISPSLTVGAQSALDRNSMLPVLRAKFRSANGRVLEGNVLIDSGAGTTIMRREFANKLGLQGKRECLHISVVGGSDCQQEDSRRLKFWLSSQSGGEEYEVEAHDINRTVLSVASIDRPWLATFNHLKDLKFEHKSGPIDLILGVQYSHLHVELEIREGLPFEPVAKRTRLGWIVIGSEYEKNGIPPTTSISFCNKVSEINMQAMYDLDTLGVQASKCNCPKFSLEDQTVLDMFENSCTLENNRYVIGLPWKRDPKELPNNYFLAKKRLESLERSLRRNPEKADKYLEVMKQYEDNGWSKRVDKENTQEIVYYLPHHGVIRSESASTPLRVVFDPASSFHGASLNSFLYKGPSTLGDLIGILLRFREDRVAFVGDISKMFLQMRLPERDTNVHGYLWRDMDSTREPTVYKLQTVTFGDKSSPEMANFIMRKIAETNRKEFPGAAEILMKDRYMDDLIHSCETEEVAENLMKDLDTVIATGSFKTKKWFKSNCVSEEKIIPGDPDRDETVKTLGVSWNCETDTIQLNVKSFGQETYTKRTVLSKLSMMYDPLGLAAVVTIRARIAMQETWKVNKLGWDDQLPKAMKENWNDIFQDLQELNKIKIPRCLRPDVITGEPELHVFADASIQAYGAVAYLRWNTPTETSVRLVAAKARVAPLHQTTIPRLELMAALIASRLARTIYQEMRVKSDVHLWSDSMIVLQWLSSNSTSKKAFVGVRIAEIQSEWNIDRWKHVPSEENPADDLSRGLKVKDLDTRWFTGPQFLKESKEKWPKQRLHLQPIDCSEDKKETMCSVVHIKSNEPIIDCEKYSSWQKLLRVTAYCFRIINILKQRLKSTAVQENTDYLESARNYWIRIAQATDPDLRDKCISLSPMEEDGILRVGGRLRHAEISYDQRFPILLSTKSKITKLILRDAHQKVYHAGTERTLAESRRTYWITRARNAVKGLIRDCVICRKLRQAPHTTKMADLPPERLRILQPPFTTTGVDLFGPFQLKYGRSKTVKAWGAIFTCATTRGVHLEIVENLSTQAFIHALRRFAAHRGWPRCIISDNGKSFVGTRRVLRELVVKGRRELEDFSLLHQVNWRFNTPLSPHQGGFYESLIKQVKRNMQVAIGSQILSWNDMSTVFAEIQTLMNSRPLSHNPDHPDDMQPLTPNHLLLGRSSNDIPQGPFKENKSLTKRFAFVQMLVEQFWKRFIREYLPTLNRRSKWICEGRQMQIGDIVLLVDYNLSRGKWRMAKIIEVYPGKDNVVRNVKVKTQLGEYKRSVQKCCVLLECEHSPFRLP